MNSRFAKLSMLGAAGVAVALATACVPKSSGGGGSAAGSTQPGGMHGKAPFTEDMPIYEPPIPGPVTTNPLVGKNLFVDPQSLSMLSANSMRQSNPAQAETLDRIAQQPQGLWMGEWNSNIFRAVAHFVNRATSADAVPVIIAYNIPHRDAAASGADAGHSAGGLSSKEAYQRWIRNVYAAIGPTTPAVVVLEPDALPGLRAMKQEWQEERLFLLNDAIRVFRQNPNIAVYIDAGHAAWVDAPDMAEMLKLAGVEYASGFSLNTSNYRTTEECLEYGHKISAMVDDKHFVIDTSRNGAGPFESTNETETWCNPPGRKIGAPPTTSTGDATCDGFLWLKRPGESDGECQGGPKAGHFWLDMALKMAQ